MGEEKTERASRTAAVMSTAAAVTAALAWLNSRKVQAAPPGTIPEELMNLVIAIASSLDNIDADADAVIDAIKNISLGGGLGWPLNTDSITSLRVSINPPGGIQLPYIAVPSGMSLVIKAWALNPGWIHVGASIAECSNVNQSFPLLPNEVVGYQIENADQLYIAALTGGGGAPIAGCFACLTVEHRKGGGG